MRRLIELSRYVVILPAIGSLIGGLILIVIGLWEMGSAAIKLVQTGVPLKESTVSVLAAVDTLLLATVLLVIGYGLYELFVDESLELPTWLQINSLDDLKAKLIGVVVAVVAVVFLGELVEGKDAEATMRVGIGAGALVIALAVFMYATRSARKGVEKSHPTSGNADQSVDDSH